MKIMKLSKEKEREIIKEFIKTLERGGLVIYPTETCYGAGVDATNKEAVEKILKYKTKRLGKAISVAVADKKMAEEYVELNEIANNIYDNYLPGPITVVSKSKGKVAKKVEADDKTLGIRIPKYPLILKIVEKFSKPITSTSANVSYRKTPYSIDDILKNTSKKQQRLIDLIIDAEELPRNKPSTVINTVLNEMKILRQGDVELKNIKFFVSNSENQTKGLAKEILKRNRKFGKKPIIFALQGELGTGKTQFVKGSAGYLQIKKNVVSPTFILVREYDFEASKKKLKLFHIDTYRMFDEKELLDLRFKEMLNQPNVIAIEWAEKVSKIVRKSKNKADIIWMKFKYLSQNKRQISYSGDF
jgi:L-threonylcarbamoyladenylate synthase